MSTDEEETAADLRLSTRVDEKPAEHGLTLMAAGISVWGNCLCGWKSGSKRNSMTVQLRFGEHLLETRKSPPSPSMPVLGGDA